MYHPYGKVFGSKYSKKGSLFQRIFLKHGGIFQTLAKNCQNVGIMATVGN